METAVPAAAVAAEMAEIEAAYLPRGELAITDGRLSGLTALLVKYPVDRRNVE